MPGAAHGLVDQLVSAFIIHKALLDRIKLEVSSQLHGGLRQIDDGAGPVRH